MLTINTARVVEWPVDVEVPMDGGKRQTQRFNAWFEIIPPEEFEASYKAGGSDATLLRRVTKGFDQVEIEGGGRATLDQLLALPFVIGAMIRAYVECATGAKRKN